MSINPISVRLLPGFNPTQISGCKLWFDGNDATSMFSDTAGTTPITPGGSVARWNDKSGNNNYLQQATAGIRPVYQKTPGGYNAVYFSANGIQLTTINNSPVTGNSGRTVFLIQQALNTTRVGTGPHNGTSPPNTFGIDNNTPIPLLWCPYVYTGADNTIAVSLRTLAEIWVYYDPSVSQIGGNYNFSGAQTRSTTLNTSASPWYFGLRPDNGGSVDSYICEFILYDSFLTTTQRQQVEGYLAWKWGLVVNLPSDNPYKTTSLLQFPPLLPFPQVSVPTSITLAPIFLPTSIPGCTLWLDGADTSSMILSGSTITTWKDKSSLSNNATSSTSPQYIPTGGVAFGGTAYFAISSPYSYTCTVFMVASGVNNTASARYYWNYNQINYGAVVYNANVNLGGPLGYYHNAAGGQVFATIVAGTLVSPFLVSLTENVAGNSALGYFNGTQAYSLTCATGPATTITEIGGSAGNGALSGNIYELIFFNSVLPSSQRQQVEGYLAWKWGLVASLPSDQPYKSVNPSPYYNKALLYTNKVIAKSFNPTSIAGTQLWLDAADPSTITGTSPVTAWRDKSGNGNNGTASGSPVLLANSLNGSYPSIYFNGSSSIAGATVISGTTLTAFCILQTTDANLNTNGRLLSLSTPGQNDYNTNLTASAFIQVNPTYIGTSRGGIGSIVYDVPVGTSALVATIFDGNTSNTFYGNGSSVVTATAAGWNQSFSITTYCIGNAINPNGAWYKGRIGEIILYSTALTNPQRQQVEGYLAWKWGLQVNLPQTHPYKLFPPPPS